MPPCLRADTVCRSQELVEHCTSFFSNPLDFLFLPQEEASKAMSKKTLEGVSNEKESQAMEEEKAEGRV